MNNPAAAGLFIGPTAKSEAIFREKEDKICLR